MADFDKALEILGPDAADLMAEFLERVRDKSVAEIAPILMEFKNRLPDREFTQQEREVIIEAALQSMPEGERNRYKTIMKMLKVV